MIQPLKLPFYARAAFLLIALYLAISMLAIAQGIILPILFATVIAVLISPAVNFLVNRNVKRIIAVAGVLIVSMLIIAGVIALLSSQVSTFTDALPQLKTKFNELVLQATAWASEAFNINPKNINGWLADTKADMLNNSNSMIGNTLNSMGGVLAAFFLMPVYIFMILYYQPHLLKFMHKVFGPANEEQVSEILTETKTIIQSYLVGLFIEFLIIAALNSAGLFILGIQYAIVLGILGALLNVIPYLGGLIAMAIFAIIALLTKSPEYALYVIGLYAIVQFLDNNLIVPRVVGSKVKLNALVSLVTVILGAALWGIPGMFLSIPLTAILKLIFDRIESLKPWGFLLGDPEPEPVTIFRKKGKRNK